MFNKQLKPSASFEIVTPQIASRWLHSNCINRSLSKTHVRAIAKDMSDGLWTTTHEGVAFDWNGNLIDGQHRLEAIIESGMTIKLLVARNIDPEAMQVIDTGRTRSLTDRLSLSGKHGKVSNAVVATMRFMCEGVEYGGSKMRYYDADKMLAMHRDAIEFALDAMPCMKFVGTAPPRGAVARSYYSYPQDRIREFCTALQAGIGDFGEMNSVRLLNIALRNTEGGSRFAQLRRYCLAQKALYAFLERRPIKILRVSPNAKGERELFPIPGDDRTG